MKLTCGLSLFFVIIASVHWTPIIALRLNSDVLKMVQYRSTALKDNKEDTGYLEPCMGLTNKSLDVHWTPRILQIGRTIVVTHDITVPEQFSHGTVCVYAWVEGSEEPIYEDCRDQLCTQFLPIGRQFAPELNCPIPKGYHHAGQTKWTIEPTTPIPAGKFRVKAVVNNEDQKLVICVEAKIEVDDDDH